MLIWHLCKNRKSIMARLRWLYAGIAASIFTLTLAADASSTCWYPDGATAEPGHVPCNQTISGASACCDPDDSCTTSGMCLGASGWVYRGSCTDSNWESGNCANQFPNCTTGKSCNIPVPSPTPSPQIKN
jgi:hypothetical protein